MKVKIGDKVYDANEEPIMLIMSDQDRNNIAKSVKLHKDNTLRFVAHPEERDADEISEWMYADI